MASQTGENKSGSGHHRPDAADGRPACRM